MKLKFVAAGAALCALGMTGCTNETDETGAQKGKQAVMTMQSATDVPQTRADYTEDGTDNTKMNFSWRSGDKMSVVVDGVAGNENCELSTTEAGKSAPFSGTVTTWTGTNNIYAVYPFSSTAYTISGGTTTLTLPNPQLYTVGDAISNSFIVGVGTATANNGAITASASLKQVMSIIKLNITKAPGKVMGVKLKCTDAIFATTATVKLSDATITNPGNPVSELSMTVTDNSTDHTATKAVSFAIFPKAKVDGKKIQIEVTYEGGKSKMIEKDDIAFARNMHYVMEFDGTPVANDYIVVGNLKIAVGNLVANADGTGCKIGAPTDGGLFFQFGSLVGWSETGSPTIAVKPANFNSANEAWTATGKIWQSTTGTVPFTATGSDDEKAGIGDPCRYYLGGTWRLPTKDEYVELFKNNGYPSTGPWKRENSSVTNTTTGLTFPISGFRSVDDGTFDGTSGYCWSASPNAEKGYYVFFGKSSMNPSSANKRAVGMPVRCVQSK